MKYLNHNSGRSYAASIARYPASMSTKMMPSSTRVGNVARQDGSEARTGMPVSRSKCRPCSGQTTVVPDTMPSHKRTAFVRTRVFDGQEAAVQD